MKQGFTYTGENKNTISFPLGGIGSGSVGLTGNGRFLDWEIFNRPNKGSLNGYSHFAIKAQSKDEVKDTRILNGDIPPHLIGHYMDNNFNGYGFGPDRQTLAGFPSFKDVAFKGEFPIAEITYKDEHFPGVIIQRAFNPFIPMNDKDSSMPAAFFEYELQNTSSEDLDYSLCLSVQNPCLAGKPFNSYSKKGNNHFIHLGTNDVNPDSVDFGEICIATDADEVSYQEYWYRGKWFDDVGVYWKDLKEKGRLKNRHYEENITPDNSAEAGRVVDTATLSAEVHIKAGETRKVRFIMSWYFPNFEKYWRLEKDTPKPQWKNYYAKLFKGAMDVAEYGLNKFERLITETCLFKDALFRSNLPHDALDAISSNISILKSPTCLRLENGEFYGWEGVMSYKGSCEGSCTHVWNYAYALPFLFPNLERSMRDLDYTYNLKDSGSMAFRLQLPLGKEPLDFRACADGQLGGVMKVYRDWKISGDDRWLKELWPKVKKSLEFAWSPENTDLWDRHKTGVLWGRQHHTLDMELFGPNSWLTGFYLGALKAGAEMASYLGETESSALYKEIFTKGKDYVRDNLFNGEYFIQQIDLANRGILDAYVTDTSDEVMWGEGDTIYGSYWSDEHNQLKYQIGQGSAIDQVVAQWHANLMGLGELFDAEQTKSALQSLYKYNFKESMREEYNPCRLYCLKDEGGITICEWPDETYKPYVPVPYSEETMNGFEYQAACHMIQEGMVEEGMTLVSAVRDRYDGFKRNPYNEFECGSNYARSMASYSLLLSFSGFTYDMPAKRIGFDPIEKSENYSTFWSIQEAWGEFMLTEEALTLDVLYGEITLEQFDLPKNIEKVTSVTVGNKEIAVKCEGNRLTFTNSVTLAKGEQLRIK